MPVPSAHVRREQLGAMVFPLKCANNVELVGATIGVFQPHKSTIIYQSDSINILSIQY